MGDNPVCVEILFQIMLLTSARGNNAISLYVLSGYRNLKATLIPVQLNYGEYPTSWLHGIFGFDLKSGKGQTACEWKSTDAKVQYASTFPWGIIDHEFYWRHSNTKPPISSETIEMSLVSFTRICSSFIQPKLQSMSDPSQNNENQIKHLCYKNVYWGTDQ